MTMRLLIYYHLCLPQKLKYLYKVINNYQLITIHLFINENEINEIKKESLITHIA